MGEFDKDVKVLFDRKVLIELFRYLKDVMHMKFDAYVNKNKESYGVEISESANGIRFVAPTMQLDDGSDRLISFQIYETQDGGINIGDYVIIMVPKGTMSENEEDKYNTTFYRIPTKEEIKAFFKN
jgi:hypothetical protein